VADKASTLTISAIVFFGFTLHADEEARDVITMSLSALPGNRDIAFGRFRIGSRIFEIGIRVDSPD